MGNKPVIALDAGHGMKTAGKRCLRSLDPNETREWWLNDRIADHLQEILSGYDCRVVRMDDTTGSRDVSLSNRVKTANNAGANMYISIHHNAGLNGRNGGGTVVFYSNSATSETLARHLYSDVVASTGLIGNRSSKVIKRNFYVIKNTRMPAFLIENGFMDSPTDVPVILSAEHAEKTAQGICNFLTKELALKKNSDEQSAAEKPQKDLTAAMTMYYYVNRGDTLSGIGKRMGIPWKDIAAVNGISSPYTIKAGQKLTIPGKGQEIYYPVYTGKQATLSAALTSLGINSTYSFRRQIAAVNGISGYVGTAGQNTMMYNLLVAGFLKKVF